MLKFYTPDEYEKLNKTPSKQGTNQNNKKKLNFYTSDEYNKIQEHKKNTPAPYNSDLTKQSINDVIKSDSNKFINKFGLNKFDKITPIDTSKPEVENTIGDISKPKLSLGNKIEGFFNTAHVPSSITPKKVYQYKTPAKDQFTSANANSYYDKPLAYNVIAESKDWYYYKGSDGSLQPVKKSEVVDNLPTNNTIKTEKASNTKLMQDYQNNKNGLQKFGDRVSAATAGDSSGMASSGNKITDWIADTTGGIANFFTPNAGTGGFTNSVGGATGKISQALESRIPAALLKNSNIKNKVVNWLANTGKNALIHGATNTAAMAPIAFTQHAINKDEKLMDVLKNTAKESLMMGALAGAGHIAGEGLGAIAETKAYKALTPQIKSVVSTIVDKIKRKVPLTLEEADTVHENPHIFQLPEAKQPLLLTDGSYKMPPSKINEIPTLEAKKPDFYASQNNVAQNLEDFTKVPKQPLMLPEPKAKTNQEVGKDMIGLIKGKLDPAKGKVESPMQILKSETKFGNKKSGIVLPDKLNKLSNKTKEQNIKNASINSGEYGGNIGQKYEYPRYPSQYTPTESIYKKAVGQKEFPFREVKGKAPESTINTESNAGNINGLNSTKNAQNVNKNAAYDMAKNDTLDVGLPEQNKYNAGENYKVEDELPPSQSKFTPGTKKDPITFDNALKKVKKFYTNVVDSVFPTRLASKETHRLATNSKSVSGIVDHNLRVALVDKNGNKIADSLKDTVDKVPKGKEVDFWEYMSHRHNIDRAREGKPVQANYTPDMSTQAVKNFETANPEYKAIGDNITNWIDKFERTWGVDTGIIDKNIYDGLRDTYKSYFPTNRDFSTLENSINEGVRRKFVDQRTPISKATGSERNITDPIENIMNLVNRTVRTAKYNEVGQSLVKAIREQTNKLKPIAEIIPTKDGMFSNLDNVVTVLEDGKPTYVKINDETLLNAMNGLSKNIGNIKYLDAATNLYKGLITQKNPIFAIRNIFRDIPTAYINGSTSNPFKFGKDLVKASKDIVTKSDRFQKYKAVGGGGGNFFNGSDVTKTAEQLTGRKPILDKDGLITGYSNTSIIKKVLHAPVKGIEWFNSLTETAPRLAEFNRILDKTGDINKALYSANDVTVNFSRGGKVSKTIDKGVPYFNAGIQGLDKFVRGFKNPKTAITTLTRAGVAITVPQVAVYLINKDNPYYQQLDNRTKDNYLCIPNIFDKDENGTPKSFIKIPNSREWGILLGALFTRTLRKVNGEPNSFKGYGSSLSTSFSPTNPVENNVLSPILNLKSNKDFADRSIVPQGMIMDKRSAYLQYDEKTSSIAKKIGELSHNLAGGQGLSPKQIDYLIKSYTGIIGQYGIPATVKGGNPLKALQSQFVTDPVYSNQTMQDFYDNANKLSTKATDKNITQNIPSKLRTKEELTRNQFNKISDKVSELNKLATRALYGNLSAHDITSLKLYNIDTANKGEALNKSIKIKMEELAKKANAMVK